MTSDEIKATVSRIASLIGSGTITPQGIVDALSAGKPLSDACWDLIGALQDADVSDWEYETLDYYGLVRLPKDADGEYIHVGDEAESDTCEDGTVVGINYNEDGRVLIAVRPHGWATASWCDPAEYHHHRTPTLESVLREYAEIVRYVRDDDVESVVNECAEKIKELQYEDRGNDTF